MTCVTIEAGFAGLVKHELEKAREKHRPIAGIHEGYAVLLEEVDEFWERVKEQQPDPMEMLKELGQIGAMAQRVAEDAVVPLLPGQ